MNCAETNSDFTVLVVDDDHDVLAANSRFLRISGIDTLVADTADSALQRLEQQTVDAIVTDLKMPDCDGLEFARKARSFRPLTPIVFFSGFATVPDVVQAMRLGAVDFLEKPIEPEDLLSTLQGLRDRYDGAIAAQRVAFGVSDENASFKVRVLAYEKYVIETSLLKHEGRISDVIASLRINRRTLNDKMLRLGIARTNDE
ncbi:MAG: response regulator [Granulosicoccus sp.]